MPLHDAPCIWPQAACTCPPDTYETAKKLENMNFDTSGYVRLTPMSELMRRVTAAKK